MKNYSLPKLYSRTKTGAVQTWEIFVENDFFYVISGQQDGKLVTSDPNHCFIKNAGKANETSPHEQAGLEAASKWDKKKKEGYQQNIDNIDVQGFFEPMLCKKFLDYQDKVTYPIAWENKLNGFRCIINKNGAFSRKGEQYHCIDHILEDVAPLFKKYPNLILDGELFNQKYSNLLNRMSKLVSVNRKPKDISVQDIEESRKIVEFYVYDALNYASVTTSTDYKTRKKSLEELINGREFCCYHDYFIADSFDDLAAALKKTRDAKLEGIVVKTLDGIYENKRSKHFMKLKNFYDAEFEIVGIEPGSGNWAGKAKRMICKLPNSEETFVSNIRGTMEEMEQLLKDKDKYIGKMTTVEYQELSEYGVPLIPYTDAFVRFD